MVGKPQSPEVGTVGGVLKKTRRRLEEDWKKYGRKLGRSRCHCRGMNSEEWGF
jgi:hypothetical protein